MKRLVLVLALTCAISSAAGVAAGTLSGVVQDSAAAPVKNVVVILACWGGDSRERHVLTDEKGVFSLQVPAGNCDVFFSKNEFEPAMRSVKIEGGKKTFLKLELKTRKVAISGAH